MNKIAVKLLTFEKQTNKNWFSEIRSLCFTYNLPNPLLLLRYPPSKEDFRFIVKTNITDFWQSKLRQHTKELEDKSLKYFKPMSLDYKLQFILASSSIHSWLSKQSQLVQSSKLVIASLSCAELGTAQPQLVIIIITSARSITMQL